MRVYTYRGVGIVEKVYEYIWGLTTNIHRLDSGNGVPTKLIIFTKVERDFDTN